MKVIVDQHKCVSAGLCVVSAPDVFDQREDDGVVTLLTETPATELARDLNEAAMLCPARAIRIEE